MHRDQPYHRHNRDNPSHLPSHHPFTCTVVTTLVLCTVTNPTIAITEIARVLKPGGVYVCVEHILADSSESFHEVHEVHPYTTTSSPRAGEVALARALPADEWLAMQQKALDPLQVTVLPACHSTTLC